MVMPVTVALDELKREVIEANIVDFAIAYLKDHDQELTASLAGAKASGKASPFADMKDLRSAALRAVTVSSIGLVKAALERYTAKVLHTASMQTVVTATPDFIVPCHRGHQAVHVLRMIQDVRNNMFHATPAYRHIKCGKTPEEIVNQSVELYESQHDCMLFLTHDLSNAKRNQWLATVNYRYNEVNMMTMGEFLIEECQRCVEAFDATLDSKGNLVSGAVGHRHKPMLCPTAAPP